MPSEYMTIFVGHEEKGRQIVYMINGVKTAKKKVIWRRHQRLSNIF